MSFYWKNKNLRDNVWVGIMDEDYYDRKLPLLLKIPSSVISTDKQIYLFKDAGKIHIGSEIFIEIGEDVPKGSLQQEHLPSYMLRFSIFLCDRRVLNRIDRPTVRDKYVCLAYSRWYINSTGISAPIRNYLGIGSEDYALKINNTKICQSGSIRIPFSATQIVYFMNRFMSFKKGDLFSLGYILPLCEVESLQLVNSKLSLYREEENLLSCLVKMI